MSTRSLIAIPTDNGFRGRYSHSDGMPTSMLPLLFGIVADRGIDAARKVLTEDHYGWSMIHPKPEEYIGRLGNDEHGNPREIAVAGVGIAYSVMEEANRWSEHTNPTGMYAWAYVLNDTGIAVFRPTGEDDNPWVHRGNVKFRDDLTPELLVKLECGENYEDCGHYAWVHDESVDRSSRIAMRKWLGYQPMSANDIVTGHFQKSPIAYGTAEYTLTGSASTGTADSRDWRALQMNPDRPRYWWVDTNKADGTHGGYKRLGRITKAGLKLDVPVTLAATKNGQPTQIASGTILQLH